MEFNYKKNDNSELFKDFQKDELLNVFNIQNYVPIYKKFFSLNENNYNSINLNNENYLLRMNKKVSENIYQCTIKNKENQESEKLVFLKLSGILDPFKFMSGKYPVDNNLFILPKLENDALDKVLDPNNCSYVDSFFSFLTSILLNKLGFVHATDFYGSYLGIKNNLLIDVCDDIDSYSCNDFFQQNLNNLFHFINSDHDEILNQNSRRNKKPIEIGDEISLDVLTLDDIVNLDTTKSENINELSTKNTNLVVCEDEIISNSKSSSSKSECSSRSSNTNNDNVNNLSDDDSSNDDESSEENSSDMENIMVSINQFPIQIIALEKCKDTFDSLLSNNSINSDELGCIIGQILMILITYQKMFSFTHNDLHTNNIMYIETEKRFLYYKINHRHYKIPTYGKIFKIIDYGRAIYKFKGQLMCSDSFHKEGDANSQYNCEPYFNENKPRLEPNFSFDLCRLGCSIYDFISEKYENMKQIKNPIHKLIINWCIDDDGRDILYKTNGEERYPDFKLYKMIARKVNKHKPIDELQKSYFERFVVSRKNIKKGSFIWNIDEIEHQ